MYISKREEEGLTLYYICETYNDHGSLKNRVLFELGPDPSKYIVYPGGNSFYISEEVELTILANGHSVDTFELEALFWPYVDPRLKRVLRSPNRKVSTKRYSREELFRMQQRIHPFDKRRLHFIRFGSINQEDILRYPYRFFNRLLDKSRDEIECMIDESEKKLRRSELKTYVYTIFQLSRHFPGLREALRDPSLLPEDRVDQAFIEEVCRLNEDTTLWGEYYTNGRLNNYLKKYVIMYFDNEFPRGRRPFFYHFERPPAKVGISFSDALKTLNLTNEEFQRITLKGLKRRYRRLAQRCHPDKGGCKDEFIKLSEAYRRLLEIKKGG